MSQFYWYSEADEQSFEDLANWWTDGDHTVQAEALPVAGDDALLLSDVGREALPATGTCAANVNGSSDMLHSVYGGTITGAANSFNVLMGVTLSGGGSLNCFAVGCSLTNGYFEYVNLTDCLVGVNAVFGAGVVVGDNNVIDAVFDPTMVTVTGSNNVFNANFSNVGTNGGTGNTFNGELLNISSFYAASCTFNGTVSSADLSGAYDQGDNTFNGTTTFINLIFDGTSTFTGDAFICLGIGWGQGLRGTFYNLTIYSYGDIGFWTAFDQSIVVQNKLTFSGIGTFYPATSSEVAPASKVMKNTTNLGTQGAILNTDVRKDTPTGAAAGGSLDPNRDPIEEGEPGSFVKLKDGVNVPAAKSFGPTHKQYLDGL